MDEKTKPTRWGTVKAHLKERSQFLKDPKFLKVLFLGQGN